LRYVDGLPGEGAAGGEGAGMKSRDKLPYAEDAKDSQRTQKEDK
jgi:hypothetical protein